MWSFSKKRFLITLGLSIVVWLGSGVIQALTGFEDYFKIFSSCTLTGYPIALCISSNNQSRVVLITITNILLWFWIIHLITGFFTSVKPESTGTK